MPKPKLGPNSFERVPTGIEGLDPLLQGGFVKGSAILVSGGCGVGKTIFGSQFLYNGAKNFNEPGVYLSLEETPEEIMADMRSVGMDPKPLVKAKKLIFTYEDPVKFAGISGEVITYNVGQVIKELVHKINAKRVVIDSTGAFELYFKHGYEVRQKVYEIIQDLRGMDVTSLIISEVPAARHGYSRFDIEEFVVDGVIALDYIEFASGGAIRSLFLRKMRRTNQSRDIYSFDITSDKGIVVKPVRQRFNKYLLTKYRGMV